MRIAFVCAHPALTLEQSGGAGTHMRGTISGFRSQGHDVLPLIAGDILRADAAPTEFQCNGSRRRNIEAYIPRFAKTLVKEMTQGRLDNQLTVLSKGKLRQFSPDVVYERSWKFSRFGIRLARELHIPLFIETSGCMLEVAKRTASTTSVAFGNRFERWKFRRADAVVAEATSAVEHLRKKYRLGAIPVYANPLGIEIAQYHTNSHTVARLSRELALDGRFVVGFVGTFQPYQGIPLLLDTAERLQRSVSPVVFLVVGGGSDAEGYVRSARQRGLENIRFVGQVDSAEIPNYLDLCHVGFVPDCVSHMFPIKTLEYGLAKLCPVVPDLPAYEDLISDGINGRKFPPGNADSAADVIANLAETQARAATLGAEYHKTVWPAFSWKNVVSDVLQAMEHSVAGNCQRSTC